MHVGPNTIISSYEEILSSQQEQWTRIAGAQRLICLVFLWCQGAKQTVKYKKSQRSKQKKNKKKTTPNLNTDWSNFSFFLLGTERVKDLEMQFIIIHADVQCSFPKSLSGSTDQQL